MLGEVFHNQPSMTVLWKVLTARQADSTLHHQVDELIERAIRMSDGE
jgi:hypothetical protein